jgi:WD40 repeat protein
MPQTKESVRAELIRLQKQTGLTLATEDGGIYVALFDKRTLIQGRKYFGLSSSGVISGDGSEVAVRYFRRHNFMLGIIRSNGENLREYAEVHPQNACWSNDKSKLAVTVHNGSPDTPLNIMDLQANVTTEIDPRASLTSQCWSPDDQKIVYQADDSIRVYEIGQDKSSVRVLAKGEYPTWSPDGNWIAFLDHNTYRAIRPDGRDMKKLFHHSNVYSGLWWSPDSRTVAYVTLASLFEGGFALDADIYQLRVRRLEDNSEDHVLINRPGFDFQWVTNPQLLEQVKSDARPN